MIKSITREQLLNRMDTGAVLVEALPEKYYRGWHLPGARHMPHDQVRGLAANVLPDKAAEIVVYCASDTCQNSHIAAKQLVQMGYTNVAVYPDGKKDWSDAKLALDTSLATA